MSKKNKSPFMVEEEVVAETLKATGEEIANEKIGEELKKQGVEVADKKPNVTTQATKFVVNEGNPSVIKEYHKRYEAALQGNDPLKTIKAFSNMLRQCVIDPTDANLQFLNAFFSENKGKNILNEKYVFQNIETLSVDERAQVETIYTMFKELTDGDGKINLETAGMFVGTGVVDWFIRMQNNNVR